METAISTEQTVTDVREGRIIAFDILKGVAAYLVVLGHIVTGKEAYRWLYQFIYSFHMPLFMFLAGCTVVISWQKGRKKAVFLARRFVNIMVPYLSWSICLPLITAGSFGGVDWDAVFVKTWITNRMFWFLPTLFGLIIGYVCYCRIKEWIWNAGMWNRPDERKETVIDIASCFCVTGIFALLMGLTKYQLFRDIVGFAIPFFAAVMYMEHKWVYKLFHQRVFAAGALVLFILLIGRFDFDRVSVATSILRMILGMCAVVMLLWLYERLQMPGWMCRVLALWGRSSLLIYILHNWVYTISGLRKPHGFGMAGDLAWYCVVSVLICCACGVFAAVLSRIPIVRLLLLGKIGGGYAKRS